ncbi:M3 family metallopeptidase [Chitinimonas koreensis]|nr:M3 family metallopeptidase [Chitinimonas koreensis]QNM94940.1 oligopeptidase A [Chitinimonas koreensis]
MENAENGETRRKLQYAYTRRGGPKNLAILHEVANLRKQLATLMGYPSFAAWATRNNMVGKPEVVLGFLDKVKHTVTEVEKRELADLAQEKARFTGDAKARIERWDQAFYERRVQKARYQIDQAEVREQFPTEPTIAWMMAVTSRLYGVEFRPNTTLAVWHDDVKAYDVFDKASGEYRSTFYLDLFPRDGKYKHAAAFSVRQASTLVGNTPISTLVTNFSRKGFDQEELETLFHEFGHIMHGVLSRTRYTLNAGTNTKRDFVEAPSQMYEGWSRNPASLALWNEICPSCKPIDMKLVAKMNEARQFGQGTKYARQWLYAAYDMALAGPIPQDPLKLWKKMEGATPLGYVKGTEFPGTFGHIVGGYAAGYYGYMWSEVLALDMRTAFGSNFMDPAVGLRFRQTILENGSQVAEMDLVRQFLGREPNSEAFFKEITGQAEVAR